MTSRGRCASWRADFSGLGVFAVGKEPIPADRFAGERTRCDADPEGTLAVRFRRVSLSRLALTLFITLPASTLREPTFSQAKVHWETFVGPQDLLVMPSVCAD